MFAVMAILTVFFALSASAQSQHDAAQTRLDFVATAPQLGPVGYRDPLGVVSPSGDWLAYSTARRLFVQRTVGGPVTELPPCNATIRHLAWLSDDHTLV